MKLKQKMLSVLLSISMLVGIITPYTTVYAEENANGTNGENEAVVYEIKQSVSEEKDNVTVDLTLTAKENVELGVITLPDGSTQNYDGNTITFTENKNGTVSVDVAYHFQNSDEGEDAKHVQIPIDIAGINTHEEMTENNDEEKAIAVQNTDYEITSFTAVRAATGTESFDGDDGPGNDSGASNNILRSYDQATYQLQISGRNFPTDGTKVKFKATLNVSKKYAEFDENAVAEWLKDIKQEDVDGKCTLTGTAVLRSALTGEQLNKAVTIKAKSMKQGEKLIPQFSIEKKEGSDDYFVKEMSADNEKCIISAKPMFDLELVAAGQINKIGTYDFSTGNSTAPNKDQGNVYGRMIDYGVAVRINSNDAEKKQKGLYIPEDIDEMTFTIQPSVEGTTIKPLLWDYKKNTYGKNGQNNRDLSGGITSTQSGYVGSLPLSNPTYQNGQNEVFDGGNWTMVQNDDGSISVTVKGAKILDEKGELHAPTLRGNNTTSLDSSPENGNIYISTGYFSLVVPVKDSDKEEAYNLIVEDSEMKVPYKDSDGTKVTTDDMQSVKDNDKVTTPYQTNPSRGSYAMYHYYAEADQKDGFYGKNLSSSTSGMGMDGYSLEHNKVQVVGTFAYKNEDGSTPNAVNYLMKIDDKALKPSAECANGVLTTAPDTGGEIRVLYAAKKDKSGWNSDEEMKNASEQDLKYYTSLDELEKDGAVCVGVLAEMRNIKSLPQINQIPLGFNADILDTAKVGEVYQIVHTATFYNQNHPLDASDSRLDGNAKLDTYNYRADWSKDYQKTQYDSNYVIKNGSDTNAGYQRGASLLIIGVEASVSKKVDGNNSFDLATGVTQIPYVISPVLNVNNKKDDFTIRNVTITDVLPKGLKVSDDTKYYYGESEIKPASVKKQADGTTEIVWKIKDVPANVQMPEIKFSADIDFIVFSKGTATFLVKNTAKIRATGDDRPYNTKYTNAPNITTADATIVINSSLGIQKQVLTPNVETNDDIQYRVSFFNSANNEYAGYKMLDVLPFNGDNKGTQFEGEYGVTAKLTTETAVEVYYSTSEDVRKNGLTSNSVDEKLFKKATVDKTEDGVNYYSFDNEKVTALMVKGSIESYKNYVLDITLIPENNHGGNVYKNKVSCNAAQIHSLNSSTVEAKVYERTLSGTVWYDSNKDGIMDNGEEKAKGIIASLYLIKDDGTKELAKDRDGQDCVMNTDKDGNYKFSNLNKGNYTVEFETNNPDEMLDYSISPKEAGTDSAVTSKADAVLNAENLMEKAEVANVSLPTLNQLANENIVKHNTEFLNLGIYKITLNKNVTKTWDDNNNQDGIRPAEIKVQLYANDKKAGQEVALNEGNNWSYTFTDLDKYKNGKEIDYTLKEVSKTEGYKDTVELNDNGDFVLTNAHTPAVIEKTVKKEWDDNNNQDGIRPTEAKIQLFANGNPIGTEVVLNEDNNWNHTFVDLPKFENGAEINYTIQEVDVANGYTYRVETDKDGAWVVTNTHVPDTINKSVTKVWDDNNNQDGIRPGEVKVQLYANDKTLGDEVTLNNDNNWSYTFADLAKNENGQEIVYTVKEVDETEGYTSAVTMNADGNFTLTNTHAPEIIEKTVKKEWDDNNNQDGIRPTEVKMQLYANGNAVGDSVVLTEADNWEYTFKNLAKYEKGQEIDYTVQEVDVANGYTYSVETDKDDAWVVTNTHVPDTINKSVIKVWDDKNNQDGIRPDQIKVQLYANDEKVKDEVVLNAGNNWSYMYESLDKYKEGKEINYTIKEVEVEGYTSKVEINGDGNFVITNTHTPTGKITPNKTNTPTKTTKTTKLSNMPKTGDSANIPMLVTLLIITGALVILLMIRRIKNTRN